MKMNTSHTLRSLLATCILILGVKDMYAANRTWQNGEPLGGSFSDSSRWSSSMTPGVNDTAIFNGSNYAEGSEFTVTLTENVINQWLRANSGSFHMTLDLNGFSYTTTATDANSTYVQTQSEDGVTLTLTGGIVTFPVFEVARSAGYQGKLILTGNSTILNTSETSTVGNAGKGELEIINGANLSTTSLFRLANNSSAEGHLLIDGAGSKFTATSAAVVIGDSGTASLKIKNGGQLVTSGGAGVVRFALSGGSASGEISGLNSKLEGADVSIGGSGSVAGGTAQVYVNDRGSLVSRGTMRVFDGSLLEVDNATVSANSFIGYSDSTVSLVLSNEQVSSFIAIANDLTLETDVTLSLRLAENASFLVNDVLSLISYGGTLTGTFAGIAEGDILEFGDYQFLFSYGTGIDSAIIMTVIPEPKMWASLLGVLVGFLMLFYRRRSSR